MNSIKMTVIAGITALGLAGCVTDGTNNSALVGDLGTLAGDVTGIIGTSGAVSAAQVAQIQAAVGKTCAFVPTAETVVAIAGLFNQNINLASGGVNSVVNSICSSASTKLTLSRASNGQAVTLGSYHGVPIRGYRK